MSSYRKGTRYERKIRDILRGYGWTVWRLAGSKPVDLVAFRNFDATMVNLTARRCHDIAIIECKNYRKVRKIDVEKLSRIYKKVSKPCYLVVPTETGNFVYCVKREIVWGSDIEEVFK